MVVRKAPMAKTKIVILDVSLRRSDDKLKLTKLSMITAKFSTKKVSIYSTVT